ncbi:MAG TPA: gamma-glutamyltransferase, partial [Nitriliruptorales bacterium]
MTNTLDPATWPADEVEPFFEPGASLRSLEPAAGSWPTAMVIGSTGPFAQYAGRRALQAGGSAVDAAIVTSLTQIALAAGSWVSYAGMTSIVYFDAATGQTHSLSGPFRAFLEEDDPLSIPPSPQPSGRTAMVPGYPAAIAAAHERFGRLAWAELCAPAIYVAERGFPLIHGQDGMFQLKESLLKRTPEGREFLGSDAVPAAGEVFRQPALARTLRAIADDGVDHVYRGPWAQKFVEVVRREGGRATLADLERYEVIWDDPLVTTVNGHEVHAVNAGNFGGAVLLEGLNLLEEGGVGDWRTDGDALYWLCQVARQSGAVNQVDPQRRVTKQWARTVWEQMSRAGAAVPPGEALVGSHSDYVACADEQGNVLAMTHTINTGIWGQTGIFVDGVSVPDAGGAQKEAMLHAGPGGAIPNPMNPAIVLRDGKPVLASSSIGSGLPVTTLQCVASVLLHGATVAEAAAQPLAHGIDALGKRPTNTLTEVASSSRSALEGSDEPTPQLPDDLAELFGPFALTGMFWYRLGSTPMSPTVASIAAAYDRVAQIVEDGFDDAVLDQARQRGVKLDVRPREEPTIPRG